MDWALAMPADLSAAQLSKAPVWFAHLVDAKGILGGYPFQPPARAMGLIATKLCEVCQTGGVKLPPRALGLTFGLWGHDKCVEDLLSNAAFLDASRLTAAGAPSHKKSMYNPHAAGQKDYTLTLVRDRLHTLIPDVFTAEGLQRLSVAQARAAGAAHRAEHARLVAQMASGLGPARLKRAAVEHAVADAKAKASAAKASRQAILRARRIAREDARAAAASVLEAARQARCEAAVEAREDALGAELLRQRAAGGSLPATLTGVRYEVGYALLLKVRWEAPPPTPLPVPTAAGDPPSAPPCSLPPPRPRGRPAPSTLTRAG
jgi:hypothetical protein